MRERKSPSASAPRRHGAAWGAGSPAAKRVAAARASGSGGGEVGDFGRYMAEKVRKLGEQFRADASNKNPCAADVQVAPEKPRPRLFEGVSIYVNGFTSPSHQELRDLMLSYGGNFENYFSKTGVTHIICSNLPDSKIKDLRSFSKGLPILKPQWVVDSIAAGKLLSWGKYQLERTSLNHPLQRKLSSFFEPEPVHGREESTTVSNTSHCSSKSTKLDSEMKSVSTRANDPFEEDHMQISEQLHCASSSHSHLKPHAWEQEVDSVASSVEVESSSPPFKLEEDVDGESDMQPMHEHGFSNRNRHTAHSTAGDANFVKNYFKYSRLHFIGTWRNRYQGVGPWQQRQLTHKSESDQLAVIHIDMDCFFVSVVTRNHPEMAGKPVAVCHSDSSRGTAEISSANYEARHYGVKAGMFVRDAKLCCPNLEIVPYDFEGYEQVAEKFYDILHRHSPLVQAISCDEAYVDVTGMGDPAHIASSIRREIFEATKCTASAGISGNILLARLATKKAKPNGQYQIRRDQAEQFVADLPVEDLPGVGWALCEKLHRQSLFSCSDLRIVSKDALQRDFGSKTGEMLWNYARGTDHRKVQPAQERKSIGAEVNWGIRFSTPSDAQHFLVTLSEEVSTRLNKAAVYGRTFTLKVKKRKYGAGEPEKFMGCGSCDNINRSATLPSGTDKSDVILRVARQLFASLNLEVCEVRGVGLQVTRLESSSNQQFGSVQGQKSLESWINSSPQRKSRDSEREGKVAGLGKEKASTLNSDVEAAEEIQTPRGLPPASELDYSVLASLPPEVFAEINQAYNGALSGLNPSLVRRNEKHAKEMKIRGKELVTAECSYVQERNIELKHVENCTQVKDEPQVSENRGAVNAGSILIPTLSQLDRSVLEELPSQLQKEIMDNLPGCNDVKLPVNLHAEEHKLWDGFPPIWVQQFQDSGSEALKNISGLYLRESCPRYLSCFLITLNALSTDVFVYTNEPEDSFDKCSELIRQYIQVTLPRDLEEVAATIRLVKRMAKRWCFWNQVQTRILPAMQDNVLQIYGGHLKS